MTMTLLNFETHFRAAKVEKAREMFLRDQVTELRKAKDVWAGRMKIGYYQVQISLENIKVDETSCTCDSSRYGSGYCEHKIALLFALRKELDLYPALTNSSRKLVPTDTRLQQQVEEMNHSENSPSKKSIKLFTDTANAVLLEAETQLRDGNYRPAAAHSFEVIKQAAEMDLLLGHNYAEQDKLTHKAFDLVSQALEKITEEELLDHIAYDLRIEFLRAYRSNDSLCKRWMSFLPGISKAGSRREKFHNVLNTVERIEENYPVEEY